MINKISQAFKKGTINNYMKKRLQEVTQNGVDEALVDELLEDAQYASDLGVDNEDDYNAYFFVLRFSDDILDDTFGIKLDPHKRKDLHHFMMEHRRGGDYNLDDLTDYRLLIYKWLCNKLSKQAYPNISGKEDRGQIYDIDKWINTLKNIYTSIHNKRFNRKDAINNFTLNWDLDEKQKFINWMRYYEDGTAEKYNVKTAEFIKKAFEPAFSIPESWVNREDRSNDKMYMSTRQKKQEYTKREEELHKAKQFKNKMKARLRSFKRLVEKYNDVLPKQDLDNVYDELYKLEKSVNKLDVYASLQDCVIRSANIMNKCGFIEGAAYLYKCAEDQIDSEVLKSLPEAKSKDPDLPPQSTQMSTIQTIIDRLESISKSLKSRDMIRELASIDILLNDLGMASYFPELTDAQAKMIESFGYASNKIENIIAKLRGSGSGTKNRDETLEQAPIPVIPKQPSVPVTKQIDTGELMSKPVGKIKKELPTE
jgi:hypothetical protein